MADAALRPDQGAHGGDAAGGARLWHGVDQWDRAIEEEFFVGQWADRPVYLDLEEKALRRIATSAGVGDEQEPEAELVEALRPTFHLDPGRGLLREHLVRERLWSDGGRDGTPPFLAVLAFFSLVAESMRSDGDFRASNYYGRLCQALEADPGDRRVKTKVVNGFMEGSPRLWGALNAWLEDHGGRLGLPTAYAFDSRVYVGVPMSQALLREADRRVLPELFAAFRLRPGQIVSRSDMARVIGEWAGGSGLSLGLKRLLAKGGEVAERVADIACLELEHWDGSVEDGEDEAARETELKVLAYLRSQPVPRLYLDVGVEQGVGVPAGRYGLADSASSHAAAALRGVGGGLTLRERAADGWRGVEDSDEISIADLLLAELRLTRADVALHRAPRRLVVLERDEELRRYVEADRVQLGTENILLCHESLCAALEPVLTQVARAGFSSRPADELPGVPEGWVAYEAVEILAISDTKNVDLMSLIPVSWTQISLGGGFPLPGRLTWLADAPPEVRAVSLDHVEIRARLDCERSLNGSDPAQEDLATFTGASVIALAPLPDGDYRLSLGEADRPRASALGSALVRLRSADHPRPVVADDEPTLRHRLADPWGALAADAEDASGEAFVEGGWLDPAASQETPRPDRQPPASIELSGAEEAARENDVAPPEAELHGGEAPVCLMGGGHYFLLEPAGPQAWRRAKVEGVCKRCGLEKWFPGRPQGRRRKAGRRRSDAPVAEAAAPPPRVDVPPISPESQIDWDRLLEGLCFGQQGTWASFDALASHLDDSPWFALEAARLLSSLGHLDLALDHRTLRPTRWCVAGSTLTFVSSHEAVLNGYRSRRLVERLADDASALGGELVVEGRDDGPSVVEVRGLARPEVEQLASSAGEALEREIRVACDGVAVRLAALLPGLDGVLSRLPFLERSPDLPVEQFCLATGEWNRVAEVDLPGAYRFHGRPLCYCVSEAAGGALRVADNRMAKWLAARDRGVSMLAFDDKGLVCPLGAQLPGLFERAAVLASGRPPTPRKDGTVLYSGAGAELAERLWGLVGPREGKA